MNIKKWKLGIIVAAVIGFFTACSAAAVLDGLVINFKFFLFFIGLMGKDIILYLKDHPVDQVSFDTEIRTKPNPIIGPSGKLPLWLLTIGLSAMALTGCKTPPQTITYRAEGVIITSVDTAMTAWADYVRTHPQTPQSQRAAVHKAYDKYYIAQKRAEAVLAVWVTDKSGATTNPPIVTTEVQAASEQVIATVKGFLK